jgi:hypothetical protein
MRGLASLLRPGRQVPRARVLGATGRAPGRLAGYLGHRRLRLARAMPGLVEEFEEGEAMQQGMTAISETTRPICRYP